MFATPERTAAPAKTTFRAVPSATTTPEPAFDRVGGLPEPVFYLLVGLVTAPVFTFTPVAKLAGWFFRSLCHEIGHSAAAWLTGRPAFPAINPGGHGVSIWGERHPMLVALFAVCAASVALRLERRAAQVAVLVASLAVYPALVLGADGLMELGRLLAGHGGELVFAAVFLWRAACGGFTESNAERGLYATCGAYLVGNNLWLSLGLVFSPERRAWYSVSGSYGLTNDYIRVADQLGWAVSAVGACMTVVALVLAGVGVALGLRAARD